MMTKAINTLVLATVDSLTKFKNKLAYYLAIFAMVFGSTFGNFNAANAADVTLANSGTSTVSEIDEVGDALIAASDATAHAITLNSGDITAATLTNAAGAVDLVITVSDNSTDGTLTISGNITATSGNITFLLSDNTTTLSLGGNFTESGEIGSIKLNDTDIVEFTGTTKNIDAIINGVASDEGTITLAGVTEFDDIVGGVQPVKAMNVSASMSGDFNAAVDVGIITNLSTLIFEGALGVNTLTNSGTVTTNAAITNVAANNEASIVMHTTGSILNFNGTSAATQDLIITATTDGFGTINIFDETDDAAGGTTTLAAASLIGASGTAVGTLNIGKTDGTKPGNLVTVNAAAMFVDNVNITGGNHEDEDSTLSLIEALTSTTITLSATGAADATLKTLTATVAIAGTIDSASGTDGAGFTLIDADIATQFAGNIGATVAIEKMDIAGIKVDVDGATNAIEAILFSADGTLELGASSAQTLTGAVAATTNEHGLITNANTSGVLTISGTLGAEDKRIKEVSLLDNTNTTFQSAVFALDLDINTAAAEDVTTFTIGNVIGDDGTTAGALDVVGGTFVLDTAVVSGTTVFDTKEVNNADGGVELRALVIQPAANFTNGTVTFIDGATASTIDAADVAALSITNTALTTYTISATAGVADITIAASAKSGATTGTALGVTTNEGTAIHQLMASAIASDSTVVTALNDNLTSVNGGTLSVATDLAKQTAPQTDTISGSAIATRAMTGTVQGIISNRMASLRSGDAYVTGVAAGNGMSANSGFLQVFGSDVTQKNTSTKGATVFGYESETKGLALGFDGITAGGSVIGLSLSRSNTDVTGKGTGKSKNDIESLTASIYADKVTDNGYLEGSLTIGTNDNASSRIVNTAGLDRTYKGAYDSEQVSLKIGGGVPAGDSIIFFGNITGTLIQTDSYTETSATASDALRLKIAQDDVTSIVGSLGFKAHQATNNGTAMISLAINNEFGDNTINSTNTYTGGGTAFKTSTEVEALSATLGLGLSFGSDMSSINLGFEAEANQNEYLSSYGTIKFVKKF